MKSGFNLKRGDGLWNYGGLSWRNPSVWSHARKDIYGLLLRTWAKRHTFARPASFGVAYNCCAKCIEKTGH
jgi:hypothetical protein